MELSHEQIEAEGTSCLEERTTPEMLILFQVGRLHLGLDVGRVREITRAMPISVPLPGGGAVVGMIALRGESMAVIDLGRVLGVRSEERDRGARMIAARHGGTTVCLLVDRVNGLHEVTSGELVSPPPVVADLEMQWLDYVMRPAEGQLIGVIDIDRILSRTSLKAMDLEANRV